MIDSSTAELHLAYAWDCENCSHENFERAVVYEFSPQAREEMTADLGESPETGPHTSGKKVKNR